MAGQHVCNLEGGERALRCGWQRHLGRLVGRCVKMLRECFEPVGCVFTGQGQGQQTVRRHERARMSLVAKVGDGRLGPDQHDQIGGIEHGTCWLREVGQAVEHRKALASLGACWKGLGEGTAAQKTAQARYRYLGTFPQPTQRATSPQQEHRVLALGQCLRGRDEVEAACLGPGGRSVLCCPWRAVVQRGCAVLVVRREDQRGRLAPLGMALAHRLGCGRESVRHRSDAVHPTRYRSGQ